jgi:hypothetical protein
VGWQEHSLCCPTSHLSYLASNSSLGKDQTRWTYWVFWDRWAELLINNQGRRDTHRWRSRATGSGVCQIGKKKSARVPAERRHMTRAADEPDNGDPRRRSASSALAHASVLRCTRRRAALRRSRDSAPAREFASPAGPNHAGEAVRVHARRAPPRHSTETCESWPGSAAKHAARRGGRQLRRMREKSKTPSYVIAWDRHTK